MSSAFQVYGLLIKISRIFAILLMKMPSLLIKMYRTYIPIAVKAAETSSKGKSIFAYEPGSTVSKAYTEFTKEVLADGRKKERLHSHEAR